MTYYEEFAIPPTATVDEIRQAHRRLIKILHPDLQTDAGARQLAEIQTTRINGICQTLLDPTLRKEYQDSLERKPLAPLGNKRNTWAASAGVLATACLIMIWALSADRIPVAPQPPTSVVTTGTPTPIAQGAKSRPTTTANNNDRRTSAAEREPTRAHRDLTPSEATGLSEEPPREPIRIDSKPEPARERPAPPTAAPAPLSDTKSEPTETKPALTDTNPFIGTWVYVPEPISEADNKLYRPEYIEMRIRDVKGILEGQYRARYHVPDRPLSPNVGFHFTGPPGSGSVALRWTGSNGTAGQLELKLLNMNSVQADWKVTEMAASADLVSGTAILTRVQ